MKLVERELGLEIELKENVVPVIVLENVALRLPMIEELYSQVMGKEGNWLLAENEKSYELAKKMEIILEPFSLEINSKKVKAKLYQDIKKIALDSCFSQGLEVHARICSYLENLLEKIPYPVKYEEEWNIIELLKAYGVELAEECDNICEKLFNYIKLISQVCEITIFITVNLKLYLTKEQILELYKLAMYNKIQLVLIEFNMFDEKFDCEETYIIDKDGCIITY